MCKVALFDFLNLQPVLFKTPPYKVCYSSLSLFKKKKNTTTKAFAHVNEQILQIAVAGGCMCVSLCVCVCPILNKKQYKTIQILEMNRM